MTWPLRGLAILLLLAAVAAALVGYRLSTQPPAPKPVQPTENVVQSVRALRAGVVIQQDDVAVIGVVGKPAGSLTSLAQAVGQVPVADIAVGQTLTRAHFPSERQLMRKLHRGERAVAIKVDEVAGLGGFARPGDWVDVLYFLRGNQETSNTTLAQVILPNVRLLAYGEAVESAPVDVDEGAASSSPALPRRADKQPERPRSHSSAVLAVPEAAASRLMLAANSGALRLSLRPVEPGAATGRMEPYLIRLADLAALPRVAPEKPAARPSGPVAPTIVLHEGDAVRSVAAGHR